MTGPSFHSPARTHSHSLTLTSAKLPHPHRHSPQRIEHTAHSGRNSGRLWILDDLTDSSLVEPLQQWIASRYWNRRVALVCRILCIRPCCGWLVVVWFGDRSSLVRSAAVAVESKQASDQPAVGRCGRCSRFSLFSRWLVGWPL